MPGPVVADTHIVVRYFLKSKRLSKAAFAAIDDALLASEPVYVSAITLVEIIYLIERHRVPRQALEMLLHQLHDSDSSLSLAPLDEHVAIAVDRIPRNEVPEMPDRIIGATALAHGLPLVTADERLRSTAQIETIW